MNDEAAHKARVANYLGASEAFKALEPFAQDIWLIDHLKSDPALVLKLLHALVDMPGFNDLLQQARQAKGGRAKSGKTTRQDIAAVGIAYEQFEMVKKAQSKSILELKIQAETNAKGSRLSKDEIMALHRASDENLKSKISIREFIKSEGRTESQSTIQRYLKQWREFDEIIREVERITASNREIFCAK